MTDTILDFKDKDNSDIYWRSHIDALSMCRTQLALSLNVIDSQINACKKRLESLSSFQQDKNV